MSHTAAGGRRTDARRMLPEASERAVRTGALATAMSARRRALNLAGGDATPQEEASVRLVDLLGLTPAGFEDFFTAVGAPAIPG